MSTQDEESAPMDNTQASDAAGEAESGGYPSPEAVPEAGGESIQPTLERQLRDIKSAMEQKDWQGIVDILGLESVIIEGHPEPFAAVASRLYPLTANLSDFEAVLLRVSKQEVDAGRARFSFRFRVMWNSSDDWEDHDLYVD